MSPHGGRRQGAGAPKGNRNALKHGRRSSDRELRAILSALPASLRDKAVARLKAVAPLAAPELETPTPSELPLNVTPLYGASRPREIPTPPPTVQSNAHRDIIARLDRYGFRNAAAFVKVHAEHAGAIEDALDYADTQDYIELRNPPGLIRDDVHLAIAIPGIGVDGRPVFRCPACRWEQADDPVSERGVANQ